MLCISLWQFNYQPLGTTPNFCQLNDWRKRRDLVLVPVNLQMMLFINWWWATVILHDACGYLCRYTASLPFCQCQAVVKIRWSAPERCSATSNFSRVALRHLYFSRGELRSSMREGETSKGVIMQQIMTKKGHESCTEIFSGCYMWPDVG